MTDFLEQFAGEGIVVETPESMQALGEAVAAVFPENRVMALHGDMGTGKTTFVRGLARGWGITATVNSPTFSLLLTYRGPLRNLLHLDAWRLKSPEELPGVVPEELMEPPWCLAVEWPDRLDSLLPEDAWQLVFSIEAPGKHRVKLTARPE